VSSSGLGQLKLKGGKKVLMTQLRRVGDALVCTPAIRAFKRTFPESCLFFMTELESASLFTQNPYLDGIISVDKDKSGNWAYQLKKIAEIRSHRFVLVVDFLSNPRSGWYTLTSGARHRIGLNHHGRGFFYSMRVRPSTERAYAAIEKLNFLSPLNVKSDAIHLDLYLTEEAERYADMSLKEAGIGEEDFVISISPTSRRHFNRWPLEGYAEVIGMLHDAYKLKFLIIWGPGERKIAEELKRLSGIEEVLVSPQTSDLLELGAILKRCHLHLGNDNGSKHIAVAMGLPTVTIFGPHDPVSWTFPGPERHLYLQGLPLCDDCLKRKHSCEELSCLHRVTTDQVFEALSGLIDRLPELREAVKSGHGTSPVRGVAET
jgi:heptosyltransferase-3